LSDWLNKFLIVREDMANHSVKLVILVFIVIMY